MSEDEEVGFIQSVSTLASVERDGNVLQTLVNFQDYGSKYHPGQLEEEIISSRTVWPQGLNAPYITGGITISGADPLFQHRFLTAFLGKMQHHHIPIALDTTLLSSKPVMDRLMDKIDLWMVSLKYMDNLRFKGLIGEPLANVLENILYLDYRISQSDLKASRIRIKFVLVPNVNDDDLNVGLLGSFATKVKNLDVLEIVPFSPTEPSQLSQREILTFEGIRAATIRDIVRVRKILKRCDISIKY
ncbi:MAG: hypothetical protein ACE5DX_03405 [Candidatus Dojkabacteria bacterium]